MPTRVCRTQEEWDERQRDAVNTLERLRNNKTLLSLQRDRGNGQ